MNNIVLSICIPTYNRSQKTSELAKLILDAHSNIEVIAIDNCSTSEHIENYTKINNPNFKLVKRDINIGGNANVADAYSYSTGKYSLLCLDKDSIDIRYLKEFLELLETNPNLAYGQCALNLKEPAPNKSIEKGFYTVMSMGYDCHHPTGFFVCNEILKKTKIIDKILADDKNFPFNTDIIKAHMIMAGDGIYVNSPLMKTETLEEAAKQPSHTYSGDNIWFYPKNVTIRIQTFIEDAQTLGLNNKELSIVIERLYYIGRNAVTFGLKSIFNNPHLCSHHGIETKTIGFLEMFKNLLQYNKSFLKFQISIPTITILKITSVGFIKFLAVNALNRR